MEKKSHFIQIAAAGRYETWFINPDGSGLQQLTKTSGASSYYPELSPDGRQMTFGGEAGTCLYDLTKPLPIQDCTPIQNPPGLKYQVNDWSSDGKRVAGSVFDSHGQDQPGLWIYSLDSKQYQHFADSAVIPGKPKWMPDGVRVLFEQNRKMWLLNTATGKMVPLMDIPKQTETLTPTFVEATRDSRTLYFIHPTSEADIWMANLK